MAHVDIQMVMKTYGKWSPSVNCFDGYETVHNWDKHLKSF